jgi:hypothetical protein
MKISPRKKEGKRAQCPKCKENYLQSVYMNIGKKQVKIGEGCPLCLPEMLRKEEK